MINKSVAVLSEPETPEFNLAILKVAKWLQMSKDIGDVFTGNGQAQRSTGLNYKHRLELILSDNIFKIVCEEQYYMFYCLTSSGTVEGNF